MQTNNTTLDAILERFAAFDDAAKMDVVLETMADVITPDTNTGWVLTDDDSFQCRRRLENNAYHLIQVIEFPNHFRTAEGTIRPEDYTWCEVLSALATYGYELELFLTPDNASVPAFNWAHITEMLFEEQALECMEDEFTSYEEAARAISEKTGIKAPVSPCEVMRRFAAFKSEDNMEYVLKQVNDLVAPIEPHPWIMQYEGDFRCRKQEKAVGFLEMQNRGDEYLVVFSVISPYMFTWKDVAETMEKYGMTIDQFIKENAYVFHWEEVAEMLFESCDKTFRQVWERFSTAEGAATYIATYTGLPLPELFRSAVRDDLDSPSREEETVTIPADEEKTEALPVNEQRLWMFALRQTNRRTGECIGKTVGVVRAASEADAWNKAWAEYGSDVSCGLEVWDITDKDSDAYTVYRGQM